jgi:hypothetical protein
MPRKVPSTKPGLIHIFSRLLSCNTWPFQLSHTSSSSIQERGQVTEMVVAESRGDFQWTKVEHAYLDSDAPEPRQPPILCISTSKGFRCDEGVWHTIIFSVISKLALASPYLKYYAFCSASLHCHSKPLELPVS